MKESNPPTFEQALANPSGVFTTPEEVLTAGSLTRDQRKRILKQWEYDARELEVAEEENMGGGPPDRLSRVLAALEKLGADPEAGSGGGKQG